MKGRPTKKVPVNSSRDVMKTKTALANKPGAARGRLILKKAARPVAPTLRAASSRLGGIARKVALGDPDAENEPHENMDEDNPGHSSGEAPLREGMKDVYEDGLLGESVRHEKEEENEAAERNLIFREGIPCRDGQGHCDRHGDQRYSEAEKEGRDDTHRSDGKARLEP